MQGWSNPNVRWSIHPDHSANGNFVNSTLPTGQQLVPGTQTQVLGGPQQNLPSHVVVPGLHTGTHGPQHQQLQAYPVMATTGASVLMSHPERSGPSTTNGGPPGNAPMHPYLTGTSFPFSHAALSSGIAQAPPVGSPALLNNAGGAVGVTPAQFTPSNTASSTNHLPIPTPPSHKLALPSSMLTNATPGQPPTAYLTSPKGDNTTGMGSSPAPGNSAQMLPQSNGLLQFPLNIAQLPAAQSAELFQQLSKLYNVGESTPGPYDTHTTPSGKDCAEEDSNDGDLCIEFDSSETPHIQEPPAAVPPSVGINPNQMSMESHGVSLSPAPPQRHSSLNTGVSFERISSSPLFHMPNTHNIPSSDVTHTPQSMTLPSSSPIVQSTPNLLSSTDVPGHAQTPAEQAAPAVAFIPEISDPVIDIPTKEPQDRTDSDLVPSDSQADPGSAGSKRGRVTFTEAQTITLDCVFHRRPYPTPAIRQALATRLNLSELQVNAWFVRRRAKSKASGSNPPAEGINRIALNKEDPGPGSFPYPVSAEVRNLVHEILDHKAPSNSPVPLHTPPVSSLPQPSTTTPSSSVQLSQQSKVAPATPNPPDKRLI
ncbi:homeobox protein, partial [Dispira parvispora]